MPLWIGVPLGVAMMLLVAGHLMALSDSGQPASRRRIRQANGGLMLVLIPLLTAGFSIIDPRSDVRMWILVWLAAMPLLLFVLMFAGLDMVNTWRLTRARREALRAELRGLEEMRDRMIRDRRGAEAGGGG